MILKPLVFLLKQDQNLSIKKLYLSDIHRFNILDVDRESVSDLPMKKWKEKRLGRDQGSRDSRREFFISLADRSPIHGQHVKPVDVTQM